MNSAFGLPPGTLTPLSPLKNQYLTPMPFYWFRSTLHSNHESSAPSMTRILILDNLPEFRRQLHSVIAFSGLVVAGEAGSVPEALELLPAISPDLAIVDINLPGINGIEGTLLLKHAMPSLRVILISAYADQSSLLKQAAARVGAECFLSKDQLTPEVIQSWERR